MKHHRFLLVLILAIFFNLLNAQQSTFTHDCFSILVGKEATKDGSVIFAHNEDDWGDRIVNFYKVPAMQHKDGEIISMKNGGELNQVSKTWSYLWLEMPEMEFSDTYMNEWGVTIGSDACMSREKKPDITDEGIGYWLRRAMAERATSAREAVKIGGALVEKYGYTSSGRTYCIAGPNEAWMLSVVNGKHWVAQRIPDDHVAIIPNYYTITTVDLTDTMNFYGSDDLIEYAIKRKWYKPEKNGEFNFRLVYSDQGNLENTGNIVRHWSAINLMFSKGFEVSDEFPFSYIPQKKIELSDLFQVLRNHNEGSEYDKSENYTLGNPHEHGRAICSNTTQYGFVAQLRMGLPKEMAYVMWLAPFRPCVHPFTQWYFGMTEMPEGFAEGNFRTALDTHFDPIENVFEFAPDNTFLKFVTHAKNVDQDYDNKIRLIKPQLKTFEDELIKNQEEFERNMLKFGTKDTRQLTRSLTDYSKKQVERSLELIE